MANQSNVNLIDPNKIIGDNRIINSSPDYEKMNIFVELTAQQKGRTVLVETGSGNVKEELTGQDKTININMMGFDQDTGEHTTNWIDNTKTEKQYEGFGIKEMKIITNSSFIPTVNIEFIDIRGMSFFNQGENSPYKILFDFPPPIFNLTIKGYYGKALTYQLHLVKYNSKFNSDTGNYHTNAEFVARTFAPLSDVLFKYVEMFPLMSKNNAKLIDKSVRLSNPNSLTSNNNERPKNTYELLLKLKKLYNGINERVKTSKDNKEFELAKEIKEKCSTQLNSLNYFSDRLNNIYQNKSIIAIKEREDINSDSSGNFRVITDIRDYNTTLKLYDNIDKPDNIEDRLYLCVLKTKTFDLNNELASVVTVNSNILNNNRNTLIDGELIDLKSKLIKEGKNITVNIKDNDIINPDVVINDNNGENIEYIGIDITDYYFKLRKIEITQVKKIKEKRKIISGLIEQISINELGMKPTIYNIFEILCDDIDYFFNVIKNTSIKAQHHHNEYVDLIINNKSQYGDNSKNIFAFPLIIKEDSERGILKRVKSNPKEISDSLGVGKEFPELGLINNFINTFINVRKEEQVRDLKNQEDDNGNNKWLPISPVDTTLLNDFEYQSPYYKLQFGSENNSINEIFNRLLNRYYVLSQNTYNYSFFDSGNILQFRKKMSNSKLIDYLAGCEAVNLANSLKETTLINSLITFANNYKTNNGITQFYDYLDENVTNYNTLDNNNYVLLNNTKKLYRNRKNENYQGVEILDDVLSDRIGSDNLVNSARNPVDKYIDEKDTFINKISDNIVKFNGENFLYIKDDSNDGSLKYYSDYIESLNYFNKEFKLIGGIIGGDLKSMGMIEVWSIVLSEDSNIIINLNNTINDSTGEDEYEYNLLLALLITSNYSTTKSPFNTFKLNSINNKFRNPIGIQTPYYVVLYTALLFKISDNDNLKNKVETFFNENPNIGGGDLFIENDLKYVDNLSENDKKIFTDIFDEFYINEYPEIKQNLLSLIDEVNNSDIEDKDELYGELLTDIYRFLPQKLNIRKNIIIYNEITFNIDDINPSDEYETLLELNQNLTKKSINNNFFKSFFKTLESNLNDRKKEIDNIEKLFFESITDSDIKTQCYYSFKNISDKWISGNNNVNGFPLNNSSTDRLINKFVFVDRAMNYIGDDCILNTEILLDLANDYDVNMFTVFSKLLSLNGFEFFPINNFMKYTEKEWDKTFEIHETIKQDNGSYFVCMYIGGSSSYLNQENSDFVDDGIIDLENSEISDFNSADSKTKVETTGENKIDNGFPYKQVRAFKVKFGDQNQSIFKDIEIDSKEYPETNESLAILSKLASDESGSTPVPKGQNLFNLYENRAYSSTISMLGDMMIQPTQYYQIENIPLFSGAYVILSVEHDIIPNYIKTNFSGVRILKYPNPIVKDFATIIGFKGGTSEDLSGNENGSTTTYGDNGVNSLPASSKRNDVINYKIPDQTQSEYSELGIPFTTFDLEGEYFSEIYNKNQIVLHHTVSGDDDTGDLSWWLQTKEAVATTVVIIRSGAIIEAFPSKYWSYHIGLGIPDLDKRSIGIEIDSWGALEKSVNGNWYPLGKIGETNPIPFSNVQEYSSTNGYPSGFRGNFGYEKYTKDQIKTLETLLKYYNETYNIPLTYNSNMWDVSIDAKNGDSGIWGHISFRYPSDKSDPHPQPELIKMLQNLT